MTILLIFFIVFGVVMAFFMGLLLGFLSRSPRRVFEPEKPPDKIQKEETMQCTQFIESVPFKDKFERAGNITDLTE